MQVLVIGAGVVGLAVARAAAGQGHEVVVAEQAGAIGTGISSRNSEVIHGGMYYPAGTLRARHCVRGRRMLYAFCASHGVPHRKCGKLIVATNAAELDKSSASRAQGADQRCRGPGTDRRRGGARDGAAACHASARSFAGDRHHRRPCLHAGAARRSRRRGGAIALNTPVEAADAQRTAGACPLAAATLRSPSTPWSIAPVSARRRSRARSTAIRPSGCRGWCWPRAIISSYAGRPAFRRLIYPTPVAAGSACMSRSTSRAACASGRTWNGSTRTLRRSIPARADVSMPRIRTYWPGLPDGALTPDYSGIRPKLSGPGEPQGDFLIDAPAQHGLPGLVQMFGIELPGLDQFVVARGGCCRLVR